MKITPRATLVVAGVATTLALVSTGGAVAGSMITSAQIKDNSVTSADVKDGTLGGIDVKDGSLHAWDLTKNARKSLSGQAGKDGKDGKDGVDGTDGADGTDGTDAAAGLIVSSTPTGTAQIAEDGGTVATVTLDAPADGVAYISAQAEFNAQSAGGFIEANILSDGNNVNFSDWDAGDVDGLYDQKQSSFVVIPVTKGEHTYTLNLSEYATSDRSNYYGATIAAQYVPTTDSTVVPETRRSAKAQVSPNKK